jgi:uncharacterized protein YeaO (DUF488 family)
MIRIKRVYDLAEPRDGERILIDRLWPRGVSKEKAHVDEWRRDLAPSDELRKWFNHDPAKWDEFKRRYRKELRAKLPELKKLSRENRRSITLVYGAHDNQHNNAAALKEFLDRLQSMRESASGKTKRKVLRASARARRSRPRAAEKSLPR